jgi:ABC-2 type transport system ATP-binding protein
MEWAVETQDLGRVFRRSRHRRRGERDEGREVVALRDVNLTIGRGDLFGLLGPNGAGKTTLIKILATLLLPSSGSATVAGFDVARDPFPVRERINMVSGGETSGYGLLTVRENAWMFSQFYGIPSRSARKTIDELLKTFDLWDKRNVKVRTLSTGERQKMNMVRGFATDPEIIFLDEPTLGLDVNAARTIRGFVKGWVEEDSQRTVLLTTHYMMEADEMCDRIAIIDQGGILACDTPENLKKLIHKDTTLKLEVDLLKETEAFRTLPGVRNFAAQSDGAAYRTSLTFILQDEAAVSDILSMVVKMGAKIHSIRKTEPTLEDVFISLVGRGLEAP